MIAIHHRKGSFSEKWIEYCKQYNIQYKLVNCYDYDIVDQLKDCSGFMWHWAHWDTKAIQFSRQLTYSLEHVGVKVFPDSKTCWHFDDKIGQKYLLETINAPLVQSYVFYDKNKAIEWAESIKYPKVFKLRGGAGSLNVKLIKSKNEAISVIKKSFGRGFISSNILEKIKDRWVKFVRMQDITSLYALFRGVGLFIYPNIDPNLKMRNREKGYIYFQEFIPGNDYDIRIIIIGNRAFGIKRMVRENDFRASGGGMIEYKKETIPKECIRVAFKISQKLSTQCTAFDFIKSGNDFKVVEISYGFSQNSYYECPGYWDNDLNWKEGLFYPEYFIIKDFISRIKNDI